jgi:hypothetical protein
MKLVCPTFLIAATLCGCADAGQSAAVDVCEGDLLKTLRSPSTYNQVQASVSPPEFEPKVWTVSITYDADNAFGTPVRGGYFCAFKANADGDLPSKIEMEADALNARMDMLAAQTKGQRTNADNLDVFPCCLSEPDKSAFTALWPEGAAQPQ